jgi:hypothetical protein
MGIHPMTRVMLVIAAAPLCACAVPELTISVFNGVGATESVIRQSVGAASAAFRSAGISTRWVVCDPTGCDRERPDGGEYLEIFILPRQVAPLPNGAIGNFAGSAIVNGGLAHPRGYAFYDVVQAVAFRTLRPMELVLACVIVHEAGHLLGLSHQAHGAMRASLDPEDIDGLQMGLAFCSGEKKKLRIATERAASLARW